MSIYDCRICRDLIDRAALAIRRHLTVTAAIALAVQKNDSPHVISALEQSTRVCSPDREYAVARYERHLAEHGNQALRTIARNRSPILKMNMPEGEVSSVEQAVPAEQGGWRTVLNWICAILISVVFLAAGLWKASDPMGAAVRLAQARVPESLSVAAAVLFGIAETFTGVLLLVPRFRRWGSWLGSLLLISFIVFIGIHYRELAGADCSCFPWLKRAVGPQFFIGDGIMLLFAIGAGVWSRPAQGIRGASLILGTVAVFALVSYGVASTRHTGIRAPQAIAAENGPPLSLGEGKVFIYFFDPHCLHCLEAGKKLAALDWTGTRFIGVPTDSPGSADGFMQKSGLNAKGQISTDVVTLRKLFHFDLPPAAVALEDGYEKAMLLQFEDLEPGATVRKLGFAR